MVDRVVYNSQDKVRLLIQKERRIELAGEGHRYFDIRRWGIAPTVMKDLVDIKNSSVQKRSWSAKLMKLPVPQAAVDKNSKLNPNNPGY
ncbi:SusD family protein [compost metagenome]